MITKPPRLSQRDLTRALRSLSHAGLVVSKVEIDPSGKVVIVTECAGLKKAPRTELETWLASNAHALAS